jgi:hypothetical protein
MLFAAGALFGKSAPSHGSDLTPRPAREVISMGEKNHENLEKPNKSELPPKDRGNIAKEIGKIAVKGTTTK